ncbi:glycosyltransferase family 2 protein [Xanthobacter sp. TB0139]|uniref:glycosyltransferase family 2 protein n=1 Tax=Xanthobacter sp. TB0139 TaxID=3459178 RepID=UPI004039F2A6
MTALKLRLQALWRHPFSKHKREAFSRNDYTAWVRRYAGINDLQRQAIRDEIAEWGHCPTISIVIPVYNPNLDWLRAAVDSIIKQIYPHWEICLADDCSTNPQMRPFLTQMANRDARIKVTFRERNGHISAATNSAMDLATGQWMALMDQDDLLPEDALFYVARAIHRQPDVQFIYTDEDKIRENGARYDPSFKPDWNPDLLRAQNIVSHLGVYRLDRVREIGGFREGFEGAQDHDLVLRLTEQLEPRQIHHIPRVLYHWRAHRESTAQTVKNKDYASVAGQKALTEHLTRRGISGSVEILTSGVYRVHYALPENPPLVTLIIPTRNGLELVRQCIESILERTSYPNYDILLVDNNSDDPKALLYFKELEKNPHIQVLRDERPFNYSAINNNAVAHATGAYVALINNDIEVINPEWLNEMMGFAIQPGVGVVGARLWYPDNRLQHGGVILGLGGVAGHAHKFLPRKSNGYLKRGILPQTLSAVTAACFVVRKDIYENVGGLDEEHLKVAFNDVDFCLRVGEAGFRNVWTPYAELYHHESASRGSEDTPEKQARFRSEANYMMTRWKDILPHDPAYNPNLTRDREDFSLSWPPRTKDDPTPAS